MIIKNLKTYIRDLIPNSGKRYIHNFIYNTLNLTWKTKQEIIIKIKSPVDWTLYNDIFVDHEYDKAIFSALKKQTNILDLGANVGFFILRLMALASKTQQASVVAIEPDNKNIEELKRRLGEQNLAFNNRFKIKIIKGVAGKKCGFEKMYFSHNYHMNTVKKDFAYAGSRQEIVKYIDLNNLLKSKKWDLIKVDIEGSEEELVRNYGLLFKRAKNVIMEIHRDVVCEMSIICMMKQYGFLKPENVADHGSNVLVFFQRSKKKYNKNKK